MKKPPQSPKTAVAGSSKSKVAKSAKKPTAPLFAPLASDINLQKKQRYSAMGSFECLGKATDFPNADRVALLASILYRGGSKEAVEEAVTTALRIYDCYNYWIELETADHWSKGDPIVEFYGKETFTFRDATIQITGKKNRPGRALTAFNNFVKATKFSSEEEAERNRLISERINYRMQNGFSAKEVFELEEQFSEWKKSQKEAKKAKKTS